MPILALTFWSKRYGDFELRRIAAQVDDAIKQTPDVSAVALIGGQRREIRITLDPARLAAYNLSPLQVAGALGLSNRRLPSGQFASGNQQFLLETGQFLRTADDVRNVVAGVANDKTDLRARRRRGERRRRGAVAIRALLAMARASFPAVTIAVSKRKGTNAVTVADNVLARLEPLRGTSFPSDVEMTVTRNYGETATEKSNELLCHMLIAVISVSVLIAITLGFRESLIVFIAIPVTLALTLTVFYLYGYTLNRITLFALIFSIGILVDDAIVVVENIVRHWRMPDNQGRPPFEVAIEAVDEVGNPTILATLAVVAAILPMAFVGGLMGPYMRPIPIGASAAMLFSLLVAFIVTPWAAVRLLKSGGAHHAGEREDFVTRLYRRVMGSLLHRPLFRWSFLGGVVVLLLASCVAVLHRLRQGEDAAVRQQERVPGDRRHAERHDARSKPRASRNCSARKRRSSRGGERPDLRGNGFALQLQRPGAPLLPAPRTQRRRHPGESAAEGRARSAEPRDRQAGPPASAADRRALRRADQGGRSAARAAGARNAGRRGLRPESMESRIALARQIRDLFKQTKGVVDVDWYVEDDQTEVPLLVDEEKAALNGISEDDIARAMQVASGGYQAGLLHQDAEKEDVPLTVRLDRATRSDLERIQSLKIAGRNGRLVALGELVRVEKVIEDKSIYHKNLMPVTYVTADIAGEIESPVYAILKLGPEIDKIKIPEGYQIEQHMAALPSDPDRYSMKWDGEWHITYEVFRDLGIAFAAVLILIYGLVVGWFQSFLTPLIIMAAIPFSLVGILPAHGLLHAFFTATSMIGFIAGAGIVVRNSIILVDFIELRLSEGMPLDQAVIDAGAVRFRPMMLTAAAVVVGSSVILFDPIFQGLAIALMAGEIASLLLSRMTVPVLFYLFNKRRRKLV